MMHEDMKMDKHEWRREGQWEKRMESGRGSTMEAGGTGRQCRVIERKQQRPREKEGGSVWKRGCEAMRRKSTAHWGAVEMMEGSQLRHRDSRMETE